MKADFSRDTFDKSKHFLRVLMQQGRVQLDADWNEQVSILLHYLQTLAKDLIGPHGGPNDVLDTTMKKVLKKNWGFELVVDPQRIEDFLELNEEKQKRRLKQLLNENKPTFIIGKGRYYVDGLLCENDDYIGYAEQSSYSEKDTDELKKATGPLLVYLDVWERHITYLEDEDGNNPSIREVALGGPDTATRAKVVWQVKVTNKMPNGNDIPNTVSPDWRTWVNNIWPDWLEKLQSVNRGQLKAKGKEDSEKDTNPCITSPEARYRGAENQLYRVEIHKEGQAGDATFKWSRENGSVFFSLPAQELATNTDASTTTITLEHLGRDNRFSLKEGDWVEIVNDDYVLQGGTEPLLRVEKVDPIAMQVTLKGTIKVDLTTEKHPLLRRWDQKENGSIKLKDYGAVPIKEGDWLDLENGIQIQFQSGATYRTGDYWLIPARTATGDVEWPGPVGVPEARPPHGIEHHYAPLAIVSVTNGTVTPIANGDLRLLIDPLGKPK